MTHRHASRTRFLAAAIAVLTALSLVTAVAVEEPPEAAAYTTKIYRGAGNAPKIGAIGDSTLAAVRWYNTYGSFYRYNFVFDAESCRRTIDVSCRGREGYAPENVVTVMRRLSGRWGRVLVLMTGYDDPGYRFDDGVDAVVAEARRQGIDKVMWLTLRTADVAYVAPEYNSNSYTFRDNNRILLQKAVQYRGYVQVADWATYSANRSDWVESDGVHLTYSGTNALTTFITNQTAWVLAGGTVTPAPDVGANTTWSTLRRGDYGSRVATVQQALIDNGFPVQGGADGDFGAFTEDAVRRFQRRAGLRVSGVVGERTAIKLGVYVPPPPQIRNPNCTISRRLKPGDQHSLVTCLERHLVSMGFRVNIDRRFNVDTTNAVSYFKAVRGGHYDGFVTELALQQLGAWKAPPDRPECRVSRTLRVGDQLRDVLCLRKGLRAAGFNVNNSYQYGEGVRESVAFLRARAGMQRQGPASEAVLRSIGMWRDAPDRPGCKVSRPLARGDVGFAVGCLKKHLRAKGFDAGDGRKFGRTVELAIRYIQRNNGLPVDGVASERLLRRMNAWLEPGAGGTGSDRAETPAQEPPVTTPTTETTPSTEPVPPPTTAVPSEPAPPSTIAPPQSPAPETVPASTIADAGGAAPTTSAVGG